MALASTWNADVVMHISARKNKMKTKQDFLFCLQRLFIPQYVIEAVDSHELPAESRDPDPSKPS